MHRPRKSLGQNFLIDPNIQQKIVDAVAPGSDTDVLEIGPGTGALTHRLAGRARRLTAIELDDDLARALEVEFHSHGDVRILHGDALDLDVRTITDAPERLTIVGNIPYNITTPLIFHLLERERRPGTVVLMVQREVADRILARPGEKAYGALSVGVRAVADADRLFHVGRGAFRPTPNVDSTVLRITPHRPPRLSAGEEDDLRALTRATFGWRRKQLQKILRSAPLYGLDVAAVDGLATRTGIDFRSRPEDLAPDDFIALSRALRDLGLPESEPAHEAVPHGAHAEGGDTRP